LTEGEDGEISEAETYLGVSVLFIDDGRDPVMTIKEHATGVEREHIQLKDYDSKEALRGLMKKYGFGKRTKKEYERYKSRQRVLQESCDVENEQRRMEEAMRMERKKDEIAARVQKMMEENVKRIERERRERELQEEQSKKQGNV